MKIGDVLSSEELDSCAPVRQARMAEDADLTSLSEAARRLLERASPVAAPMISRAGVRAEARRVRAILRARPRKTSN
jgi:hypothetical protein